MTFMVFFLPQTKMKMEERIEKSEGVNPFCFFLAATLKKNIPSQTVGTNYFLATV